MRTEDFPNTDGLTKRAMVDVIMQRAHASTDPSMVRYYMSWKRDQIAQHYRMWF